MSTLPNRFTVRVYGILFNMQNEVLISHENINGFAFTKFPGGGLEFGEGSKECIMREFKEETGIEVNVASHLYTSDFYIQSEMDSEEQVIGIYFKVLANNVEDLDKISIQPQLHPFRNTTNTIRHRWIHHKVLSDKILTFEMDRAALAVLKKG